MLELIVIILKNWRHWPPELWFLAVIVLGGVMGTVVTIHDLLTSDSMVDDYSWTR